MSSQIDASKLSDMEVFVGALPAILPIVFEDKSSRDIFLWAYSWWQSPNDSPLTDHDLWNLKRMRLKQLLFEALENSRSTLEEKCLKEIRDNRLMSLFVTESLFNP